MPGPDGTAAVPEFLRAEWRATEGLSPEECLERLKESVGLTEENIRRSAVLVRRLVEAGRDISLISSRYVDLLRRVAYGQVLPALLVRHMNGGLLLARAAALPLPDQQDFAEDRPIQVVERAGGDFELRALRPSQLSPRQISQVFSGSRLRPPAEQVTYIKEHESRAPRRRRDWVVNTKRRTITILPGGEALELGVKEITDMLREISR